MGFALTLITELQPIAIGERFGLVRAPPGSIASFKSGGGGASPPGGWGLSVSLEAGEVLEEEVHEAELVGEGLEDVGDGALPLGGRTVLNEPRGGGGNGAQPLAARKPAGVTS